MTTENVDVAEQPTTPEEVTPEALLEMADLTGCELTTSMVDWLKVAEQDPEACVPCDFGAVAPWYRDMLIRGGEDALAAEIDALGEGDPTGLEIAETLDRVKASVDNEAVVSNLKLYDCMMQSYREEKESED